MNIAFVNSTRIWSGVKTWMLEFGRELQKMGHQVYFFARDPVFVEETGKQGCVSFGLRFGADYSPLTIGYFFRKFKQLNIDITCMNIQKELRSAGIAAKMLQIPVIHRVGLPGDINSKLDQRLSQKLVVDKILVTSDWIRTELIHRFDFIPEDKVYLVHNSKQVERNYKKNKKRPVPFVITSRLAEGKGHLTLIRAFEQLVRIGHDNFLCDIYGSGPREGEIREAISQAGLSDRLNMKGFRRDIRDRLKDYSFGLLTSREEGFPNTVAEYLSQSLPCITTDGGGTTELIEHGRNGFLYSYKDADHLQNLIRICMEMSDQLYSDFSYQARKTMVDSFDLHRNVRHLEHHFQDIIDQSRT